ncbi:23S ribosomal RNA methyltransferase Erm [Streptomyces spectabilis]|uniref:23S ribosomal RNA methyltransferase Erm n=1 Tax=Streptomyces spectabilis TaxID=68270 RepID=UPI0033E13EFD
MRTHHTTPTYRHGRHELGQNFLTDRATIDAFVGLVARTRGPIVEIGTGDGALTLPLQGLGRSLTGIEIDARRAARLARRTRPSTTIVTADFLRYPMPSTPHVLVGNLPFHETTPMLRRILRTPAWTDAVLLVQWEVARRRAGVGGATLMTAQWWPWYAFTLVRRVPAGAFRPRPNVDGGLLTIARRDRPLVDRAALKAYQDLVHRVFTGRGRGLPQIVATACPGLPRRGVQEWLGRHGLGPARLPKDLTAPQWAELYALGAVGRRR